MRQKKACNSIQPCQNCEKRAVQCRYSNATLSAPAAGPQTDTPAESAECADDISAIDDHATFSHELSRPGDAIASVEQASCNDIDSLVHSTVSHFPLPDDQASSHDWFGIGYPHNETSLIASGSQQDVVSSPASEHRGYSFNFLHDFTSRTGLVSSFDCATLKHRHQIVSSFNNSYVEQQRPGCFMVGALPFTPLDGPDCTSSYATAGMTDGDLVSWSYWLHEPTVLRLQEIVLLVKSVVTIRPNNSSVTLTWSSALEQKCLQFFSPYMVAKFLELYWSVWHPNVNIIHRPTFDPTTSKPTLLAAMALIGACVSPDPDDIEDARVWFNCVEEMVFTDDDFCSDVEPSSEVAPPTNVLASRRKLQALQASYVVCLYQNWEGADSSKRRIRRHRFSTVVSVARDIGIDTARHLDYSRLFEHEFQWIEYVVREELIRTFLWIFLLDTAFVIFNNLPHRMVIKEMKMHMASPEACFQAVTADDCFEEIHAWMPPSSPFCSLLLRDAIEEVCSDSMSPDSLQRISQLGPLNLFAVVSAFHYMIFQHQNSFGVEGQLVPIRNGLRNWIAVWERYFDSSSPSSACVRDRDDCLSPETMWKRVGFIRYSPEYWLLGSLLIERISATITAAQEQSRNKDTFSGAFFEDRTGGQAQTKSVEPILNKYDQTSMRQVNDLITDFQKFHVD